MELDPRGVVWILEPPRPGATYVMGIDPTQGIPGWSREMRTQDDGKTDNGAIEIVRIGKERDYHVCEYAAPVDVYDLAHMANLLGRLYGGANEDGQCLTIPEAYPGPGLFLIQEMIHKYGYTNMYRWKYLDRMNPVANQSLGFYTSREANRHLAIRLLRAFQDDKIANVSPYLAEEMADCFMDPVRGWIRSNIHDDRVRALALAEWAAHDWSMQIETIQSDVTKSEKRPEWQCTDISLDGMNDAWEERFSELLEDS